MKVLFIGDIFGKIGRKALAAELPRMREELKPDVAIVNVENAAHGKSITSKTLEEILAAGADFCTSGNHIFKKAEAREILAKPESLTLRPANFPASDPGEGARVIDVKGKKLLVINLVGRVFMKDAEMYSNPFEMLDEILAKHESEELAGVFVDFHAEVTSEKVAFGWHAAGRVSAVVGTHTHVPTADARVLPQGTAYVTDVGMTGMLDGVIGIDRGPIVESFLSGHVGTGPAEISESGEAIVNAVLVDIDEKTGKAKSIERVDRIVQV